MKRSNERAQIAIPHTPFTCGSPGARSPEGPKAYFTARWGVIRVSGDEEGANSREVRVPSVWFMQSPVLTASGSVVRDRSMGKVAALG